uniref:Galectin domain-containing protein n=1 Tax=Panagrellus redivivus TaxID=6233 RepID=A0A7E4VER0_PANRE
MSDDHYYKHVVIEANGIPVPREYIPHSGGGLLGSSGRDYLSRSRETLNSTKSAEIKYSTLSKDADIKTTTVPPPKPVLNTHDGTWEVITGIPKRKKSVDSGEDLLADYRNRYGGNPTEESGFIDSGNETQHSKTTTTTNVNSTYGTNVNQTYGTNPSPTYGANANSPYKPNSQTLGDTRPSQLGDTRPTQLGDLRPTQNLGDPRPLSPSNSAYLSSSRVNRDSTYETYEHTVITRTRSPSPGAKLIGFGSNLFPEDRDRIPTTETIQTTTVTRRPSPTHQSIYDLPPLEQTTVKATVPKPTVPKPDIKSQTLPIGATAPKPKKKGFCLCSSNKKPKDDSECLVPIKSRLVADTKTKPKRGKSSPPGVVPKPNIGSIESGAATWLVKANNIPVSERILDPYQSIVPNYRSPQPLTIHGITGDFKINLKTDVRNTNVVTLEARDGQLYHQGVPFARTFDKNAPLDLSLRFFGDQVYLYYFEEEIARLPAVIKRDHPHAIIDITNFQKVDAVTREGIELKQLLPQPYVNKFHLKAGDVLYFETVAYTDFDLHFLNDDGLKLDRLRIRPSRGNVKHTLKKNTLLTYTYRETHHHNVIKITAKEFGNLYHLVINDVFIGNFIGSPIEKVKGIYLETPKYLLAFQHRPAKKY